jgi:hypothetical protein
MPLPEPIYPPYAPTSFIGEGEQQLLNLGIELYARYHPGAMQQRLYQTILEDEGFKAKQAADQYKVLAEERDRIVTNLSRFRETGLGASGRGAGRTGTGRSTTTRGATDSGRDFYADMAPSEVKRNVANKELTVDHMYQIDKDFKINPGHLIFNKKLEAHFKRKRRRPWTSDEVALFLAEEYYQHISRLTGPVSISDTQRKVAASDLFYRLEDVFPRIFTDTEGNPTEKGADLVRAIDEAYDTEIFLTTSINSGREPSGDLGARYDLKIKVAGGGIEAGFYEREGRKVPLDIDGDGVISQTEREEADAYREAQGITQPLSVEEQAFLGRYIDAMRDDGKATREELGADYELARSAYEKGRMVERLPRGAAAFYDESYLRGLARLGQVDTEMAELSARPSPQTAAARRTQGLQDTPHRPKRGLPYVPPEALAAAASVSPLAAESLPWALKRVQDGDGNVEPRTRVENFTQRLIETERLNPRDFNSIVRAVNKEYPNDPDRRLEAFAYYGAFNYMEDTKTQTLAQGPARADAQMAAAEAQQFARDVAQLPELTPPEEFAPGLYPPPAAPAAPAAQPTPPANYIRQPDGSWKRVGE